MFFLGKDGLKLGVQGENLKIGPHVTAVTHAVRLPGSQNRVSDCTRDTGDTDAHLQAIHLLKDKRLPAPGPD